MNELFIEILNMSLSAGCVALIIILIRLALRKAPKIYSYALWAVVFFRLICPLTIQLPLSAVPVQPQPIPHDIEYSASPSIKSGIPAVDYAVNTALDSALPPARPINSVNPVQIVLEAGKCIWLAGTFALLLGGVFSYLRLKRRVKTATRVQDNIYETDLVKTPFVLGLIHPRIYIPTGLGEKELEYVLQHERMHIRRFDYLIKPVAFLAACMHWFNPIVWVSYALMAKDMEMSADESVMKRSHVDIRGDYSASILALSAKKSGLLSPLAFGETGVKERVKNVLRYKRPAFWVSAAAAAAVIAVSLSLACSTQTEPASGSPSNQPTRLESISASPSGTAAAAYSTEYDRVKIAFLSEDSGFSSADEYETTDAKTVAYIDSTLKASLASARQEGPAKGRTNDYMITLSNATGESSYSLYYDTLYDKAFLKTDDGLWQIGVDFARYIDSFLENKEITFAVDDKVAALFQSYGWTLDYRINTMKTKFDDFKVLSGFRPNAYYFAYNNELSKDAGMDMSGYSNASDIDAEIYRIHESMPQESYPIMNCRGIVLKNGGKIIGAFISAGRHSAFNACSLKGNDFEKVTGKTLNTWLMDRVKADGAEEKLAKLDPEQVIRKYFAALDAKDARAAEYCISKQTLLENSTINMRNEELFNERSGLPLTDSDFGAKSVFENLKSATLSKVELIDESNENSKTFRVHVNLQYNYIVSIDSGEQSWDCKMVYETPQTGWKIESFGH